MRRVAALWVVAVGALGCPGKSGSCPSDLPSGCSGAVPSYQSDVNAIFVAKCAPCHRPGQLNAPFLDNYEAISDAGGRSLDQTFQCLMPPADAGAAYVLSAQERHDLLLWLVCGAPNN